MSNKEKTEYLKDCLQTIGINCPRLSGFIQRSLDNDRHAKELIEKSEICQRKLERIEVELFLLLAAGS